MYASSERNFEATKRSSAGQNGIVLENEVDKGKLT